MTLRKKPELRNSNDNPANKIPKAYSENAGTLVRIVDYDPEKHLVKVVRLDNNKPLELDKETLEDINQKKTYDQPNSKVLKTSLASDGPIVESNEVFARVCGNDNHGFFSYREGGANIIKGPLSIATQPHQVRLAGLSTLNPLITSGFPSTIVTPIPTCVWNLPSAGIIKPLLADVMTAATIVAAAGSVV